MYQSTDGDSLPCDATSVDETQADWGRRLVEADALVLEEIHDGLWPLFSGRLAARYKSLNQQDVEDLWQRALFQLWDQRDRFQPERNVAPWLWTISKNLALDVLRSASRRIQVLIDPVDMRDFADLNASDPNGDDHANPVLRTEAGDDATGRLLARLENRCERLTGHVERLPRRQRQVVVADMNSRPRAHFGRSATPLALAHAAFDRSQERCGFGGPTHGDGTPHNVFTFDSANRRERSP